jgi:predicted TPR repeat methyltransferase
VWNLARLLDEYANADIMDRERAAAARDKAAQAYVDYLQLVTSDPAAEQAIGRLRLRAGDHVGAAQWLEQRGDAGSAEPESRLVYMEALFQSGRFDELRKYAATHAQDLLLSDGLPLEARETAKLWAVAGS